MKRLVFLLGCVASLQLMAQQKPMLQHGINSSFDEDRYFNQKGFTAFKDNFEALKIDTSSNFWSQNTISILPSPAQEQKWRAVINPAFDFSAGMQNKKEEFVYGLGLGLDAQWTRDKHWNIGLSFLHHESNFMDYQRRQIRQDRVVPGFGVSQGIDVIASNYWNGYAAYKANAYFQFELGYGRQFIGDGYRSLLMSDYAPASPYFKIHTQFWKIKYSNVFAMHQDIFNVEGSEGLYRKKYTASHFLDWEVTPWLQLGLFESIVWQADEGRYKRGFDPNYLNPIIFYRPVEFSVGSSDNALVGTNIKFTLPKKHLFYSQIVLDEFLLAELQADLNQWQNPDQDIRSGWWANKYGVQFGWRKFDWFGIDKLETRLEYNFVRPFTYAHSSPSQAYSNYNLSLAHPLGANFEEILFRINYSWKNWFVSGHVNYAERGVSPLGTNFGENLQYSNVSRTKEYENHTTQGIFQSRLFSEISLAYLFQDKWNATASLNYRIHQIHQAGNTQSNQMIYLSVRTQIFNRYFDY